MPATLSQGGKKKHFKGIVLVNHTVSWAWLEGFLDEQMKFSSFSIKEMAATGSAGESTDVPKSGPNLGALP